MSRQTDRQFCNIFLKGKIFLHLIKIINYLIPPNRGNPRLRLSL